MACHDDGGRRPTWLAVGMFSMHHVRVYHAFCRERPRRVHGRGAVETDSWTGLLMCILSPCTLCVCVCVSERECVWSARHASWAKGRV